MQIIEYPHENTWSALLKRPVMGLEDIEQRVRPIMQQVKEGGDKALKELTQQFDKVQVHDLLVSRFEIEQAIAQVPDSLKEAIQVARENIEKFHVMQRDIVRKIETMPGVFCWRKSVPIEKVGLYIPGGTAPLFSTVLMLAVPAKLAGCAQVVLCTPPGKDGKIHPAILYTANLVGVDVIVKCGGAQAVAAMTYGTPSVPAVYKIFGPGNQYVTAAKQLAQREGVAIDMPAGPSEVAILADATAIPSFVASDLLAQAEHGIDSQVVLVTDHPLLLPAVQQELEKQLTLLSRATIARQALANSKAILVENLTVGLKVINQYAPEHLILVTDKVQAIADRIVNAGSVFIGNYTPESAGDYASGTNHTLPTDGYARVYSGVSLDSFFKKITFQEITPEGLQKLGPHVEIMADAEALDAHKMAVTLRLKAIQAKA
jgi:histidinol dehydrogenase